MNGKGKAPAASKQIGSRAERPFGDSTTRFVADAILLTAWFFLLFFPCRASADAERGPETVTFEIVAADPESTPIPAPHPIEWGFTISDEDVEALARLLWSSPLRNEDRKRELCWLVFNRCDDESPLFDYTVTGNINRTEFSFYDRKAFLSDTNLRIAREELTRWNVWLLGVPVERPLPEGYLYASFDGYGVTFTKTIGG